MDTGTLLDSLTGDFTALAIKAGVTNTDGLFNRAVASAYTAMGLDPSATPTPALSVQQAQDAPWLADYYTLKSLARAAATLSDVTVQDEKQAYSQVLKNIQALLVDATAAIEARGYGAAAGLTLGRLNLDYLEPYYAPGVSNLVGQ